MKNLAFAIIASAVFCHTATLARAADLVQPLAPLALSLANKAPDTADKTFRTQAPAPSLMPRLALLAGDPKSDQEPDSNLDLTPRKPDNEQHLTESWWFWGAVAGVVVTTVAIVLIAGRPLEKPESDLGDMRAFRP